jgi:hypothetical protein
MSDVRGMCGVLVTEEPPRPLYKYHERSEASNKGKGATVEAL